jgi:hypothetical protein
MANYAVNDHTETASDLAGCLALLELRMLQLNESFK